MRNPAAEYLRATRPRWGSTPTQLPRYWHRSLNAGV
ncbi:MAG: hypothetical protein EXR86_03720 [Gammaproteobacteria bacterium]|nr:hypothetical protein [Gammaproteobacteria bacterium]